MAKVSRDEIQDAQQDTVYQTIEEIKIFSTNFT